jgi:RNA polymerase sigma-70 factor (ECF subfamily)
VHSAAPTAGETDWRSILALYDQLRGIGPSPVVELNRAVAVAEVDGPAAALDLVDAASMPAYAPYHSVRADLLRRLGRTADAAAEYEAALALTDNEPERAFLTARLRAL